MALCLGSNAGDPLRQLVAAARALRRLLPGCRASALYRTAPLSPIPQPDYLNAALLAISPIAAVALLERAQAIERRAGRVRGGERWGPRTLDIDIAWHDGPHRNEPRLELPHPRLAERLFALAPLADLAPGRGLPPDGRTVAERRDELVARGEQRVERIAGPEWTGW